MQRKTPARLRIVLPLLALFTFVAASARGEDCACPRDLWLIDTRAICDCECDLVKASFYRLDACQWAPESLESFLATHDPKLPLAFQIPGYWTSGKDAPEHQNRLHERLKEQAECRGLGCVGLRHVMWLWPADNEGLRIGRDLREKAARAHFEGALVAKLLAKLPAESRVTLVGYSFGARVATSAAHHLVGEETANTPGIHLRGVLIASAVDAHWLENCEPHSCALQRFEKVLLFTNCKDMLLKRYRVVNRNRHSPALGLVGLLGPSAANSPHVSQQEVSHIVGRAHDWKKYVDAPEIMSAIADEMLFLN